MGTKELIDKLNMTNNFDCWSLFTGYASKGILTEEAFNKGLAYAWTLDRKVAEFFAFRGKHFPKSDGVVISTYVNKEDITAIFLDRDESEVILLPNVCWVDAKVVERA